MDFSSAFLITDLDGTLLNDELKISRKNRRAIERFAAGGGEFTIATGRVFPSAKEYIDTLPLTQPPLLGNGCYLQDLENDIKIAEHLLSLNQEDTVHRILQQHPNVGAQSYIHDAVFILRSNEFTSDKYEIENLPIIKNDPQVYAKTWMKLVFAATPEELAKVAQFIKKEFPDLEPVSSHTHYLEILPAGASKGQSLLALMEWNPALASKVKFGVGDQLNDKELLLNSDFSAAVANANPELKKVAQIALPSNNDHAIAEFIEKIKSMPNFE